MGSVKDLKIIEKPTDKAGHGQFHFSDRYSVFDWGEMPDLIKNKGAALCLMGAACFENVEKKGIKSHYNGLVQKNKVLHIDELDSPTNIMDVKIVNVFRPKSFFENGLKYNYNIYSPQMTNFLIPLEIIYRNGLPDGASIFKRLKNGTVTYQELGLDHYPHPGEKLDSPIFDVSTKLEDKDRYITWREAQEIVRLNDSEILEIKSVLNTVNGVISHMAETAGLINEDGKIELAFDELRRPMLVDVAGTLDECRFTMGEIHVSKEVARIWYRKTKWFEDLTAAKEMGAQKGVENWKSLCTSTPPALDVELKQIIENMYMSTANCFVRKKLFDSPSLSEVVSSYKDWVNC